MSEITSEVMQSEKGQRVTVEGIDTARRRVTLATGAWVGNTVVLKGEALVLAPSRKLG